MKSRDQIVSEILQDYHLIANKNPDQLRSAIPAKEVWRFFIDGNRQECCRNLKSSFPEINMFYKLFFHDPYTYTIRDYIKNIEKNNSLDNKETSSILTLFKNASWSITETELDQLTLLDCLNLDKAWLAFERNEPGYLLALAKSFDLIFDFEEPLSISFIKNLHKNAMQSVKGTRFDKENVDPAGEFRSSEHVTFGLSNINTNKKGIYELLSRTRHCFSSFDHQQFLFLEICSNHDILLLPTAVFAITKNLKAQHLYTDDEVCSMFQSITYGTFKKEMIKKEIPFLRELISVKDINNLANCLYERIQNENRLFYESVQYNTPNQQLNYFMQAELEGYLRAIADEKNSLSKLKIIVNFIQSLEQLHPFYDGNCRTFCMLLLNHLLMRNGFPLAILDEPNQFDMHDKETLLDAVLVGMQNTIKLIRTQSLYNIKTDDVITYLKSRQILKPHIEYFENIVAIEEKARKANAIQPVAIKNV